MSTKNEVSTFSCITDKYEYFIIRIACAEMVVQAVKVFDPLGVFELVFCHVSYHLAPGHLTHGALLNHFPVLFFAEYAT